MPMPLTVIRTRAYRALHGIRKFESNQSAMFVNVILLAFAISQIHQIYCFNETYLGSVG